jgi:hypothetical protein
MSRTLGIPTTFTCLTCSTTRSGMWWMGNARSQAMKFNYQELSKGCGNSECKEPHLLRNSPTSHSPGSVRADQRAAIYLFADGDYAVTPDNDPHSELARSNVKLGGVRMEFNSLSELRSFQKRRANDALDEWNRRADNGEFFDPMFGVDITPSYQAMQDAAYRHSRNQVLDYDHASLLAGNDRIREEQAIRQERHARSIERFKGVRVGRGADAKRYEELKRRNRG